VSQASWELFQWDEVESGNIITHYAFEDLRKRLYLMMFPLAGWYDTKWEDEFHPDADCIDPEVYDPPYIGGTSGVLYPGQQRWKVKHEPHETHNRIYEYWLNRTTVPDDLPIGTTWPWPPTDINPVIDEWILKHSCGSVKCILTADYNRYHDFDTNSPRKFACHEKCDALGWEETWIENTHVFLPTQAAPEEMERPIQFLKADTAWWYKYNVKTKKAFARSILYEPKSSGPIMSPFKWAYIQDGGLLYYFGIGHQYTYGGWNVNYPGKDYARRNIKLEEYWPWAKNDSGGRGRFSGVSFGGYNVPIMNIAELRLCDSQWRYHYDSVYQANWEFDSVNNGEEYDDENSAFNRYPQVNDEYWGCNASGFELALKKNDSYDWYFDFTYPFVPRRDVKTIGLGGSPVYAVPIGTWRRTWKYTMGRINPFYRAYEEGDPSYEEQAGWEPYWSGWNSHFPTWDNFYNETNKIVAAELLHFDLKGDINETQLEEPPTPIYDIGNQVLLYSTASIDRTSMEEVYYNCAWGNILNVEYLEEDNVTRIHIDRVATILNFPSLTLESYVGWYAGVDTRLSSRHDPDRFEIRSKAAPPNLPYWNDETAYLKGSIVIYPEEDGNIYIALDDIVRNAPNPQINETWWFVAENEPDSPSLVMEWIYDLKPEILLHVREVMSQFVLIDMWNAAMSSEWRCGDWSSGIDGWNYGAPPGAAIRKFNVTPWGSCAAVDKEIQTILDYLPEWHSGNAKMVAVRVRPTIEYDKLPDDWVFYWFASCTDIATVPANDPEYHFAQQSGNLRTDVWHDAGFIKTHYDYLSGKANDDWIEFYPQIVFPYVWWKRLTKYWARGYAIIKNLTWSTMSGGYDIIAQSNWIDNHPESIWERDFTNAHQTEQDLSIIDTKPPTPNPAVWKKTPEITFEVLDHLLDETNHQTAYERINLVLKVELVYHEDETPPVWYRVLQNGEPRLWHLSNKFSEVLESYNVQDVFKFGTHIIGAGGGADVDVFEIEVTDPSVFEEGVKVLILPRQIDECYSIHLGSHTVDSTTATTVTLLSDIGTAGWHDDDDDYLPGRGIYFRDQLSPTVIAKIVSSMANWQCQTQDSMSPPNVSQKSKMRDAEYTEETAWEIYEEWIEDVLHKLPKLP